MTITTTALGAYTTQISLSSEANGLNLITAIDAALVAKGWAQYDVATGSPLRVYRSTNKDNSYKYFGIYIDAYNFKIWTTGYESWNATTHVGTNECWTFSHTGEMGYATSNSDVIVMAGPGWALIQTFIDNQPSPWSGVVEFLREQPEDISGKAFPCFAWVCSSLIFSHVQNGPSIFYSASFPRSRAPGGDPNAFVTGQAAVSSGWKLNYTRIGATATGGGNLDGAQVALYTTHAWDTTKKVVQSLRPVADFDDVRGRAIGLKALYNAGTAYNRISLPVDSNFQYASAGTDTEHWLLPETFVSETPFGTGTANGYIASATVALSGNGIAACCTGNFYYVITTAAATLNLQKIAIGTLATPTAVANGPGAPLDILFDGQYVYVSTTTGISRYDTFNADAFTSLALPLGANAMYFDGTSIWACARGSRVNNSVYKIAQATFTLTSTVALPNATAYSLGGLTGDNLGNIVVVDLGGEAIKIVAATGVATILATFYGATPVTAGVIFDGTLFVVFTCNATTSIYYSTVTVAGGNSSGTNKNSTLALSVPAGTTRLTPFRYAQYMGTPIPTAGTNTDKFLFNHGGWNGALLGAISPNNTSPNTLYCDSTRIYGCSSTGTGFFHQVNLNHPDDAANARGRLAIPK